MLGAANRTGSHAMTHNAGHDDGRQYMKALLVMILSAGLCVLTPIRVYWSGVLCHNTVEYNKRYLLYLLAIKTISKFPAPNIAFLAF